MVMLRNGAAAGVDSLAAILTPMASCLAHAAGQLDTTGRKLERLERGKADG
jgi:hypothetical protein